MFVWLFDCMCFVCVCLFVAFVCWAGRLAVFIFVWWMVDWMGGWLVGWRVGRLVGVLMNKHKTNKTSWLVGWLFSCLFVLSVGRSFVCVWLCLSVC